MVDGSAVAHTQLQQLEQEPIRTHVHKLRREIEADCKENQKLGWRYHKGYIALIVLTVGSSALASILALGFEVDRRLVGIIALIPGICAGVGDRFHFVLKKHWFYRKYDRLNALLRKIDYVLLPEPAHEDVAKIALAFSRIDIEMSKAWEQLEEEHPPAQPNDD